MIVRPTVPILETSITSLKRLHRGKVRDLYAVGKDMLLIVQTDRLSAFDVILPDPIPGKGAVLTELSFFWFDKLGGIVPNHLADIDPESVVAPDERWQVRGRAMVVKRYQPLMVEAVVRGYIIGSGWKDYQETGEICGIKLPTGLKQAQKLEKPIFTPAGKALPGEHDPNITFEDMAARVGGRQIANSIRRISTALYVEAAHYAAQRGIIIADTKFEFGRDPVTGQIVLIDEVLTPDSSRFWPMSEYKTGISPPSFDKQFVRDWLETQTSWNKKAPAPELPPDVIAKTSAIYREALRRLKGDSRDAI